MNYKQSVDFLLERLPMYQRIGAAAYKNDLENILALDDHLHHPHKNFKTIHIAGTNGKGSVAHMLASILREAGYRTGLYTSPHLIDIRERIKVNGRMIPKTKVVSFINENKKIIEKLKPSFFEISVAMAFEHFAESIVEIAVIETGLGGRLDSTNIINPILSIITNIGNDHTNLLGDTLEKIAEEKAGIIKPKTPVLIGELQEDLYHIFYYKAKENESPIFVADEIYFTECKSVFEDHKLLDVYKGHEYFISRLNFPLMGDYQYKNIQTVLKATDILRDAGISMKNDRILKGLTNVIKNTGLQGRWQKLSKEPLIICDTGHNEDGIREVATQLLKTEYNRLHVVFGTVKEKDLTGIFTQLPPDALYYFTNADLPRSLPAEQLKENAELFGLYGESYPTVKEAIEAAKNNYEEGDLIFIGGSTFVVAEAMM